MPTSASGRVFKTGRSQAVVIPKEFRVQAERLVFTREGNGFHVEADNGWPPGYFERLKKGAIKIRRLPQGKFEKRAKML